MSSSSITSTAPARENLRTMQIIFFSIAGGVFLFMLVSVFINQSTGPFAPDLNKYHTIIAWGTGLFSLVCLVMARKVLWKGITDAKNSLNPLRDKLRQYRSSLIRYLIICEVPALLGVILFMLTGHFVFQVFSAIFLGFMLAVAPGRRRVVAALELNGSEQSEL